MEALQIILLLLVAIAGGAVVLTRDPTCQVIGLSLFGLIMSVFFMVMQAPDVALSQVVIGAVGLPLMILLTLARLRRDEMKQQEQQRKDEQTQEEMGRRHGKEEG